MSAADAPILVVGAGPAGMAAAVAAADRGGQVCLIDAEPVPGGQFWRHPAAADGPAALTAQEVAGLHHHRRRYAELVERISTDPAIEYLPGHQVWSVQRDDTAFRLNLLVESPRRREAVRTGRAVVLATGAHDLPLPFPGWDLPGVLTVGGAQSLLKGHAVVAGRRVLVAGTGPFLFPVATGLARFGAKVVGVLESGSPAGWLGHRRAAPAAIGKLGELAGYAADLVRYRIPVRHRQVIVAAHGPDRLRSVTVAPVDGDGRPRPGRSRRIPVDILAVGWGFLARTELPVGFGCELRADPQGLPVVAVDERQQTSVPGVFVAGEACGIGGADLALVEGEIAGRAAAEAVSGASGSIDRKLAGRRRRLRHFAVALAEVYPVPSRWTELLQPDTVICRCEEVTAGAIARAVAQDGVSDARSAKLLERPGMGWCQGRICGYATQCLSGGAPFGLGSERPVAVPVPLGLVAGDLP